MTEFPGLPENIYEYENRFNYAQWTPGTEVQMCNVPWDSAYRDVVRFDTATDRTTYFTSLAESGYSFVLNGMVYLRYNEPIRVNVPFEQASRANYIVVSNPAQPVPGAGTPTTFYYFITDVSYIAPNTTQLNVQLDVWMTYYDRIHFDLCYVNKGHIGIANSRATVTNLASYMTEPEGLNIGDEYEIVTQSYINFANQPAWMLIMSSAKLTSDWGTISNPNLDTSDGTSGGGIPQGCEVYVCDFQNFRILMSALSSAPWVSQCIGYITAVPRAFINAKTQGITVKGATLYELELSPLSAKTYQITNFFDHFALPQRYAHLLKFYTSPYTCVEISYNNGGEIILKPECVSLEDTPTQRVDLVMQTCTVPPDVRAVVYPKHYNSSTVLGDMTITGKNPAGAATSQTFPLGEGFDMALTITNFPQVSVVNNSYLNYVASTVHTRDYLFDSAAWTQQKSIMAANLSFNQATVGMQTRRSNTDVINQGSQLRSDMQQAVNWGQWGVGAAGTAASAISGFSSNSNPEALTPQRRISQSNALTALGAVSSLATSAMSTAINNAAVQTGTNIGVATNNALTQNSILQGGYNRDSNYDYASAALRGDYETAIQGIQATVQDARLKQPTTSGQNGGDMFNAVNGISGILIKWKRLKPNYIRTVGDFWLRYGYYVNRWITPPANLKCCENFTYWKMQEISLTTSQIPEMFRQAIRGIFETGVTVWNDPAKIGKTDLADNEPLEGIYY